MNKKIIIFIVILTMTMTGVTLIVSGDTILQNKQTVDEIDRLQNKNDKKEHAGFFQGIDDEELLEFFQGIECEELLKYYQSIEDEELLRHFMRAAKLERLHRKIDENREEIIKEKEKEKGSSFDNKQEVFNDEFAGLSKEQVEQIQTLRDNNYKIFARQEAIIKGEIKKDSPRLDLETAKKIISQNESFSDIILAFYKLGHYPDTIHEGGSGAIFTQYWFDENGDEKICTSDNGSFESIGFVSSIQHDASPDDNVGEDLFKNKVD